MSVTVSTRRGAKETGGDGRETGVVRHHPRRSHPLAKLTANTDGADTKRGLSTGHSAGRPLSQTLSECLFS